MNITEMCGALIGRRQKRLQTAAERYRELVRDTVTAVRGGTAPDIDRAELVLAENDRTPEELQKDVQMIVKYHELAATRDDLQRQWEAMPALQKASDALSQKLVEFRNQIQAQQAAIGIEISASLAAFNRLNFLLTDLLELQPKVDALSN